jgi:hypothetical protein
MTETSIYKIKYLAGNRPEAFRFWFVLLVCGALMLAGCGHVTPHQQRLVSKPNMQFSGSVVFSYQDRLLTQFESGSASDVGGQSGECGSCVAGGG